MARALVQPPGEPLPMYVIIASDSGYTRAR